MICHGFGTVPESHILNQCRCLLFFTFFVPPSLFHQKLGQRYAGSTFLDLVHSADAHGRGDPGSRTSQLGMDGRRQGSEQQTDGGVQGTPEETVLVIEPSSTYVSFQLNEHKQRNQITGRP